jgi:hypothetical protein
MTHLDFGDQFCCAAQQASPMSRRLQRDLRDFELAFAHAMAALAAVQSAEERERILAELR